jgi:hypothetical protein
MCQWDGSQPEGRRCTIKPEIITMGILVARCVSRNHHFNPPVRNTDCTTIAPWCEYDNGYDGPECNPQAKDTATFRAMDDKGRWADAKLASILASSPCDVTPSPPPPPTSSTSSNGLLITLLVVRTQRYSQHAGRH